MKYASPISFTVLLVCAAIACRGNSDNPGGTVGSGGQLGSGGSAGVATTNGDSRNDAASTDIAAKDARTISGPVDDDVQGEGRTAMLLWEVSSGSPDYLYKFGEGTVANGRFSITLPSDPPDEAINSYGVGVAIVVVLPAGVTFADGKLAPKAFSANSMAGVSSRFSVIWRAPTLDLPSPPPANFWPLSFPIGYACGGCTLKPDGGSFEGFAPTSCDQIQITTYSQDQMCNWT